MSFEFFLEFCEESLSENHHFKHEKLDFHTKTFTFCDVWQKICIEDDILVEESCISLFNSTNIAKTLSFFLEFLSFFLEF